MHADYFYHKFAFKFLKSNNYHVLSYYRHDKFTFLLHFFSYFLSFLFYLILLYYPLML